MAAGLAIDNDTGAVFLYGGFDDKGFRKDMHMYDVTTFQWTKINMHNDKSDDDDGGGGETDKKKKKSSSSNNNKPSSSCPGPRAHVRMVVVSRHVVLFGGSTPDNECTEDLYVMDVSSSKALAWIRVDNCNADEPTTQNNEDGTTSASSTTKAPSPTGRYGHALCAVSGSYVALFGGLGPDDRYLNDLWLLDCSEIASGNISWEYQQPSGTYWPKSRDSHALCSIGKDLVLLGGCNAVPGSILPRGEIEIYSFETRTWRCVATCGEAPVAGPNVCLHALGRSGKVLAISSASGGIFNQLSVLEYESTPKLWTTVRLDWKGDWTMVPGQRDFFSSVFDDMEGALYVFGGRAGGKDGMIHDTLVTANFADVMGLTDEAAEGGAEHDGAGGEGADGGDDDDEYVEEVPTTTAKKNLAQGGKAMLPGIDRFKDNRAYNNTEETKKGR